MYVYMCICINVYMYIHICIRIYVYVSTYTPEQAYDLITLSRQWPIIGWLAMVGYADFLHQEMTQTNHHSPRSVKD